MKKVVMLQVHRSRTTYHLYEVEVHEGDSTDKPIGKLHEFLEINGVNLSDSVQGIDCIAHDLTEGEETFHIEYVKNSKVMESE